jgi:hypothetical protein
MKNVLALIYNNINPRLEGEFLESLRKRGVREGEEELMLAILEDAIACFQKYVRVRDARGKTLFRDAEEWILEEGSDWIFSFENICEVLGLDPKYLRQGLMRWKERMLSSGPKAKVYHLSSRGGKKYPATGPESIKDMRKAQAS